MKRSLPSIDSLPDPLAFSIADCVRLTGLSRATLYRLIQVGKLQTIQCGRRRLVPKQGLERLMENEQAAAPAAPVPPPAAVLSRQLPPFFIYCLPRSGSSWLSVFLTAFDSFCYHEPFADMSPVDLGARMNARPDYVVGAIDSGIYRRGAGVIEHGIPSARRFVLKRDVREIQASADFNGVHYDAAGEHRKLAQITDGLPVIDYLRFDDVGYLAEIWAEVICTPFDAERAKFFTEFNITRDLGKFFGKRPHIAMLGKDVMETPVCH